MAVLLALVTIDLIYLASTQDFHWRANLVALEAAGALLAYGCLVLAARGARQPSILTAAAASSAPRPQGSVMRAYTQV